MTMEISISERTILFVCLVATVIVLFLWRVRPLPLMVAGGAVGIARRALRFGDAFLVR